MTLRALTSRSDHRATPAPETPPPQKPAAFDLLTRLILPVALVIFAQFQEQTTRFWALIAFALLSIVINYYQPAMASIRQRVLSRRDERVARHAFAELKRFLRFFGEFVDLPTSHADTLHHIARSELCRGNLTDFERLRLGPTSPFKQWCYYLNNRIQHEKPSLTNFVETVREFNSLVGDYTQYSVLPVFERFPQELRPLLTDSAKSSLEAFRQRFDRFLLNYSEYLKNVDDEFTEPRIQSYYFARPKPL